MVIRLICFLLLALMASLNAAEVTATLDRESVPAGEGAQFTIEIKDGDARPPQIPQVPDFVFQGPNRGRQMSYFNGQMSSTTTFTYLVGSQKTGEYTIPAITILVDGKQVQTQPLKLKVTPSANQQPQGLPQSNATAGDAVPEDGELGFLTVELALKDRKHAWVGEIAPVRIKAWLPEGARANLRSNIQPEGSAYTLHNVSKQPQQGLEVRDGKRYNTFTWYGGLSTTKAGTYPPDLTVKATVAVRDRSRRRDPRDPFSDPFFDSVMGQFTQKDVDLKSHKGPEAAIDVRPLPKEGRPADFSGAVGKFKLNQSAIPDSWHTGEPQQLTAVVSGEGNFKLLRRPDLMPSGNWKTYEGDAEFAGQDKASFAGIQTFKWNVVPRKGGTQEAWISFSYFDPDTARYETVTSPTKFIAVAGADVKDDLPSPAPEDVPKKATASDNLAPQHTADTMVRSLTPLAFRPAFRPALYSAGGAVLLGLVFGRLRSLKSDPQRKAREEAEKATHAALHEAESFAARGDVPGFFSAARRALQVRLSALWCRPASAITLADVAARVPGDSPVVRIFREADRIEYGRAIPTGDDVLTNWRSLLQDAMNSLTA